ncbi:MAG: hypothetical protein HeimC2_29090 [Candidatus Heimdallarchaeota archaeon LC_2]|nr:MAG: hypothetical protein HeimC2_29090 [Candidatus Heimdallarchaeota archaeon LC_2]
MTESSEKEILNEIVIRAGTEADKLKIEDFAKSLSQDPFLFSEKWLKIIRVDNVLPLIALSGDKIVGMVHAKIFENVGWLEAARVGSKYRNQGIAVSLLNKAMEWLKERHVKVIRAAVDSDNLNIRLLLEKNSFSGDFVVINPSSEVDSTDTSPENLSRYSTLLDNSVFPEFEDKIKHNFSGNVFVDGQYVPFTFNLFNKLIEERRILRNGKLGAFIIISKHKLQEELTTFVCADTQEMYKNLGLASKALASQELASFVVCHAPAKRNAVQGLVQAGLGWNQPHTLIIYQRH